MNSIRNTKLAITILAIVALTAGAAAEDIRTDSRSSEVDSLFAFLNDGKRPGAAVMVIEHGQIVYSKGFGYADLDNEVRITPDSAFRLASVSKQFTTMAIMLLKERGKLEYDDPIAEYLPEQNVYPGITIRHLMTHTSGLPAYYDLIEETDSLLSNAEASQFLADMGRPDFAPGEKNDYSNSSYDLLPLIVEVASGERFADFMRDNVFAPTGMSSSLIFDHTAPTIENRVYGYDSISGGYLLNDAHFLNGIVGAGSVYATLNDFFSWDQALSSDIIVSQETLAQAFVRATLNNGAEIDYGFGWRLDSYRGHDRMAHSGSWVGFRTYISRFVPEQLTVVVLSNVSNFEAGAYVDRVADIYLPICRKAGPKGGIEPL